MNMLMKLLYVLLLCHATHSFFVSSTRGLSTRLYQSTSSAAPSKKMGELTPPEETVFEVLQELRSSNYAFRVVVVGNGAILESTSVLGPKLSIAQSPSSGSNLLTLASEDHSFEYHLTLDQVSKIVFVSKETPKKTMRIVRLLNAEGVSMSSLILADETDAAAKWYEGLIEKHGSEIQL